MHRQPDRCRDARLVFPVQPAEIIRNCLPEAPQTTPVLLQIHIKRPDNAVIVQQLRLDDSGLGFVRGGDHKQFRIRQRYLAVLLVD